MLGDALRRLDLAELRQPGSRFKPLLRSSSANELRCASLR
jgi:hypothetical protein